MLVGRGGEKQTHSCQSLSVGSEEGDRESLSEGEEDGGVEKLVRMKAVERKYQIHSPTQKRNITYTPIWFFLLF